MLLVCMLAWCYLVGSGDRPSARKTNRRAVSVVFMVEHATATRDVAATHAVRLKYERATDRAGHDIGDGREFIHGRIVGVVFLRNDLDLPHRDRRRQRIVTTRRTSGRLAFGVVVPVQWAEASGHVVKVPAPVLSPHRHDPAIRPTMDGKPEHESRPDAPRATPRESTDHRPAPGRHRPTSLDFRSREHHDAPPAAASDTSLG